jgi:hypothetical protein
MVARRFGELVAIERPAAHTRIDGVLRDTVAELSSR